VLLHGLGKRHVEIAAPAFRDEQRLVLLQQFSV
jgi:hypothetical protein